MQSLALQLSSRDPPIGMNMSSTLTMGSQHAREAASVSGRISEPPSPTTPSRALTVDRSDKLTNDIITALHSPSSKERRTSQTRPLTTSRRSSEERALRGSAPRPELGYHRRSSSDMLALMSQQRQKPGSGGHHRRSSSTEIQNKALPTRPSNSDKQARRSASFARLQQQQYNKIMALLTRNRPLPPAATVKDDLKTCRSAGERAILYAKKINDLARAESGLVYWLSQARPSGE